MGVDLEKKRKLLLYPLTPFRRGGGWGIHQLEALPLKEGDLVGELVGQAAGSWCNDTVVPHIHAPFRSYRCQYRCRHPPHTHRHTARQVQFMFSESMFLGSNIISRSELSDSERISPTSTRHEDTKQGER